MSTEFLSLRSLFFIPPSIIALCARTEVKRSSSKLMSVSGNAFCNFSRNLSYQYAKRSNSSIGGLFIQLGFMVDELRDMRLLDKLKTAKSVKEASDLILTKYEMPADQSDNVKDYRARKGLNIYSYYEGDKVNLVRNYLNEAQALINKALDILN